MHFYRRLLGIFLAIAATVSVAAQNTGAISSYSRFGLGLTEDESVGFTQGMGKVSVALPSGSRINIGNPASYAQIDSLSLIFDVGASFSIAKQQVQGASVKTYGGSFDYAIGGWRMKRGLGIALGFMPYTTIKYDFMKTRRVGLENQTTSAIISSQSFIGEGGCHRAFIGVGWSPIPHNGFSIGANVGLIWGSYAHEMTQAFSVGGIATDTYSSIMQTQKANIFTYRIDLGAQYPVKVGKEDWIIAGATATLGHNTGTTVTLDRYTLIGDSLKSTPIKNALDIPYSFGIGLSWQHRNYLMVAADYTQERWAGCKVPVLESNITNTDGIFDYSSKTDRYSNRHKVNAGLEFYPSVLGTGNSFFKRMRYRLGAFYSTPYLRIMDSQGILQDGPSEYGISFGVGIPIINRINNRSSVNLSFEWKRRQPQYASFITENYYMIHLGITFNERWFMKYKIL